MTGSNLRRSVPAQSRSRDGLRAVIAAARAPEFPVAAQCVIIEE